MINSHGEQKIKNLIGKKGDMIFFNPVGLHKGKLPLKSNRTAIIANFTHIQSMDKKIILQE